MFTNIFAATFTDMIKNKFLEEFTGEFSATSILVSLLLSFVLGLVVMAVYKLTYTGVFFNKSYAFGLVLSTMITAVIIATVNSNLALSLGMVGALSIVRFRTAVKDPTDTIFMFWTVAVGIMTGAGFYYVSVLATVVLAALYLILFYVGNRQGGDAALLIVRFAPDGFDKIKPYLSAFPKRKDKSRTVTKEYTEIILEVRQNRKSIEILEKMQALEVVKTASLVAYKGDFSQ